jgi:hypothetical protein
MESREEDALKYFVNVWAVKMIRKQNKDVLH